jgi:hypothetical protein
MCSDDAALGAAIDALPSSTGIVFESTNQLVVYIVFASEDFARGLLSLCLLKLAPHFIATTQNRDTAEGAAASPSRTGRGRSLDIGREPVGVYCHGLDRPRVVGGY